MGKVIAVANQKGGVGKTTTAVNLAACLAAAGKSILLVDMDPQGNATQAIGLDKYSLDTTVYDVLINDVGLDQAVQTTPIDFLQVLPASRDLVGAEIELVNVHQREFKLVNALAPAKEAFDYILIDCPPSLSLLTLNALVAADSVLIALQCEYFALEGLSELLRTIKLVRDNLNTELKLQGILLTMVQRTNLSHQVMKDVRDHLGDKVYSTIIPRNVALSEAPSYGKPIIQYDISSAGAHAYLALASEFLARN